MEPVTAGTLIAVLAKLGAGTASGPLKELLHKAALRRRVASSTTRAARSQGMSVGKRAIRQWLSRGDVIEQLAIGSSQSVNSAVSSLAWIVSGNSGEDREVKAAELLGIILNEYQRAQTLQGAVVLGTTWAKQHVTTEARATRNFVQNQSDSILDAVHGPKLFDEDLSRLHPWRRAAAKDVARLWPPFSDFIHSLVSQDSRGPVLRDWAAMPPLPFAAAPAEAWCWLGLMAADHGERRAASVFIEKGIALGITSPNYWWARAALIAADEAQQNLDNVRELIARSQPQHPLASAYLALLDGRHAEGESLIAGWLPIDPNDRAILAIILSACAAGQNDLNRSISICLEASERDAASSGTMLRAAEALLSRGHHGPSDNSLADFAKARSLAIKARDARRLWQGDSVAAILVAIKASALSTDTDRAWRLTQETPHGEATEAEGNDPRLRRETAILAAMMSNYDLATKMATEVDDPYITAVVEAWKAAGNTDPRKAEIEWLNAWNAAKDDSDRLTAALGLAHLGGFMPPLADLGVRHPEAVQKLKSLHEVMSTSSDKLTLLRAKAHESQEFTVLLADQLVAAELPIEAARALESGANRWNRPLLMVMAANRYQQSGQYAKAAQTSESAVTMGGAGWTGELEAQMIRFDALEAQGLNQQSMQVARRLVVIAPDNLDVRWGLIYLLFRAGDTCGAWAALNYRGDPIGPRNVQDARIWIDLASKNDTSAFFVNRALAVMRRWEHHPELTGEFLAKIYLNTLQKNAEPTQADINALYAAMRSYTAEHPDSQTFRSYSLGPDENPLAMLDEYFQRGNHQKVIVELGAKIRDAELPLGMATELNGSSYSEMAIRRASGLIYSHSPEMAAANQVAVAAALGESVALDTTAAVTLALLDPSISNLIIGMFSSLESTDHAFRDALAAQQSLQLGSTLSVSWNEAAQKTVPSHISEADANRLLVHAGRTTQLMTATNRRNWPVLKRFSEFEENGAWLSTLDFALATQTAFWCDDLVLRSLAHSEGLPTFGTVDILRELVQRGVVESKLGQVAESVLIANYHVDLGFLPPVMQLAGEISGWKAEGAAASLTRAHTWQNPSEVMAYVNEAVSRNATSSPLTVRDWISCAAAGLIAITAENQHMASANLRLLLSTLLSQEGMRPDIIPYVVAGIRQATKQHPSIVDPLEDVLISLHQTLLSQHGSAAASQLLLMWAGHLDPDDRHLTARIILTKN